MEWLEANIVSATATFVVLMVWVWFEGGRIWRNLAGERVGVMQVRAASSMFGSSPRLSITVRRGGERGMQVIVGSHFSAVDALPLTPAQAASLADYLERAAQECK